MPVIKIEQTKTGPKLLGKCVDKSNNNIDFSLDGCKTDNPQIVIFRFTKGSNYKFDEGKAYATIDVNPSDENTKPTLSEWNNKWGEEIFSNKKYVIAGYDNEKPEWYNLKFTLNGTTVPFDPKIKSGNEDFFTAEAILFAAFFVGGIAGIVGGWFAAKRYVHRHASNKPTG